MRLLQKSTWPRAPGGQKLQPVPYSIYRSRIAINIARSLSGQLGLDKIAEFSAAGHSNELAGNSGYIR